MLARLATSCARLAGLTPSAVALGRLPAVPRVFTAPLSALAAPGAPGMHGTTVLCVRKGGEVFMIADGQVTLGTVTIKGNARKVRKLKDNVVTGFAGGTADALTLFERLESHFQEHPETMRACVEMAKAWRTDKYLRRLEAVMIVADPNVSLMLTGTGDVIEPPDGVIGIGSGGHYAIAAARALVDVPGMSAEEIGRKAMAVTSDLCIYTNANYTYELIKEDGGKAGGD